MINPHKQQIIKPKKAVIKWLLDSDPAIRWQVMRDLTKEPDEFIVAERKRVATEGWVAQLLALQDADGKWGGVIFPAKWASTFYALLLLRDMGLEPTSEQARKAVSLVRHKVTWGQEHGNSPFFEGEVEPCINGRVLALGAYFGGASDQLVDRLLSEQLEDGGWNCEAPPSRRSSFNTTICVLDGLLAYENAKGACTAVTDARLRGQEYLLVRGMFRRLSTGEVIDRSWLRFSFPPTWHYDVLRGLDYLRSARVEPDEQVIEAVDLVAKKQHQNGRWPLQNPHLDQVNFAMEGPAATASRWNTLRALRVLDWYYR
ncbi:MAG: hypothetical protein A2Y88_04195 [Chloroflexi bacterium RBG_13_48_10]|nr:MAG: hypothetical protein A2Y88_04195 [Chloroflexi bacterium RBG_13_48_10]